jgi:hypothetical protein
LIGRERKAVDRSKVFIYIDILVSYDQTKAKKKALENPNLAV